jgi:hypothetical protein
MEVNLATTICCFEPLFDPAVMNFLLNKDGQKVRKRDVESPVVLSESRPRLQTLARFFISPAERLDCRVRIIVVTGAAMAEHTILTFCEVKRDVVKEIRRGSLVFRDGMERKALWC